MSRRDAHGLNHPDRIDVALLNLAHAQLVVAMAMGGVKKHRLPKLRDFIPEPPHPERERPTDFASMARELLRLAQ